MNSEKGKQLLKLRDYQREGVRFLMDRESALLADEMGLGKTIQTAVALSILVLSKKCKHILIICPASLCINWENELNYWAPKISVRRVRGNKEDRKAHFKLPFIAWIASYEQVRFDIEFLYKEMQFDLIILDEAQRIKNPDSLTSLACRQLVRKSAWALTGTPIENRVDDLLSIFALLRPALLHSNLGRKEIHNRIENYFLRRKKIEVRKELPPIIMQDLKLEMVGNQREKYNEEFWNTRSYIRKKRGNISAIEIFSQLIKLKKICNFDPDSEESCKFDALESIIEGLTTKDDKVLVFSQYVKTLYKIKERIRNLSVDCFHGGLTPEEREVAIRKFENTDGPRILLISLKAGGVGINLSSASTVILFDRWWNPAIEDQAIQRAHRFQRKNPLHVIRFLVIDSIEERINNILEGKRQIIRGYVDEAQTAEIEPLKLEELIEITGVFPY